MSRSGLSLLVSSYFFEIFVWSRFDVLKILNIDTFVNSVPVICVSRFDVPDEFEEPSVESKSLASMYQADARFQAPPIKEERCWDQSKPVKIDKQTET